MNTETTNQSGSNTGATTEAQKSEVKPKKPLLFHQMQHSQRGGKFGKSFGKGGKNMNFSTRRSGSGGDR